MIAALHHQEIQNHPERISNLIPFPDQYSWKKNSFPDSWNELEKFEKYNPDVVLNNLFIDDNYVEYFENLEIIYF